MLDKEISLRSFLLRDTARWALANSDANLSFPHAAGTFSCALNAPVSEAATPRLYKLLRRTLADLGAAKAELAAARSMGMKPDRDCAAEAAALAVKPALAQ